MRIVVSSQPRLLHILRAVVTWRALGAGFPESGAERLAMAINEAAANVIRHTYGGRNDALLALEIHSYFDRLEFLLEDWGPKVRAEEIRPRALDEVRPGGLGTFFINSYVDSSSYDESFTEGNRLKMVKYLHRKAPSHESSRSQGG
jgi:anti-sigma regulatory factor (Ser/Thr protein kinase)